MIEKQNIDRLFQEKFKDFEAHPSPKVWKGIEARLKDEKEDRKVIPFWFRYAGIAAALLIGALITNNIGNAPDGTNTGKSVVIEQQPSVNGAKSKTNNSGSDGLQTVDPQNIGKQNKELEPVEENGFETGIVSGNDNSKDGANASTPNSGAGNAKKSNAETANDPRNNLKRKNQYLNPAVNKGVASSEKRKVRKTSVTGNDNRNETENNLANRSNDRKLNAAIADPNKAAVTNELNGSSKAETQNQSPDNPKTINANEEKILTENKIAAVTSDDTKTDTTAVATVVPNTLEELLKEKEKKTVTTNEPKINRWQISTNVAPIYLSSTSNKSPIDARLTENSKEYKADLTYGIGVRYALNKKLTVRAGVNTVGMEYTTNELAFVQSENARTLEHVKPNVRGSLIHIVARSGVANSLTEAADTGRKFSSSLNQRTGYIEVPLEMSYKLLDKKFAIELIGGFSTLFLNENSISLISSGIEMEIGEANNLSDTHFSTNFGVGLRYNFLRNFQFNVEPMFKYQINTFSDSNSYNPYMFGLYTGINYRF